MRTPPPPSRWSYGLLGSSGRRHTQTPCDFGLTRPRNVRCHQGHWSWSWPVWSLLEGYRAENPILQETELGEFLSHIVGGVCVSGLRLTARTHCVLPIKRKPNVPMHGVYRINIPPIGCCALVSCSTVNTYILQDQASPWCTQVQIGSACPRTGSP